jgi:mRNA interferase HigB
MLPFWEHEYVRIISERRVREFSEKYSDAALALANWMRAVRAAAWRTQAEVKAQFHDSDLVGDKTVFNIANNRYRLVAYLSFRAQILYIKHILTHREYDKGQWKQ